MLTKRLIQLLITVLLLMVLLAIGLMMFVDPNRYKNIITTKIEEKIHHPVTINGNINWSFWPGLGFGIENVHIGEQNSTATLADIEKINLSARLMPLLSKQVEIKNLAVKNAKVYLPNKTNLNIASLDTSLYVDLPNKRYEAQDASVNMTVSGIDGLSQAQPITFTFDKLLADLNKDELTVDKLKADIFSGHLYVNATAESLSNKPRLNGTINAENLNPRLIAQAFGHSISTTDNNFLKNLNLNATFKNTDNGFNVDPFTAQLDHSKISGNLNVSSTKPFKAQGDIAIDTITLSGTTFSNTSAHINADNNIIKFSPLKTNLPSGSLTSTTVLNMQKSTPHWDIDATLNNMLLSNAKFTGHVNGHAKVSANGFDGNTFLKTLNGNAAININDGTLNNIDLDYWLTVGESLLLSAKTITDLAINTAETAINKPNTHKTTFKEMSGTFNIQQGIAHNNDLKVYNDAILATGAGTIDLPKQQINYAVNVGRQNSNTKIPLKISGDLKSPHIGIDAAGIQQLILKGVTNGLADTLTGGVAPAIGAGEAILNSVTGNNNSSNTNNSSTNNTNTNQNKPEQAVKDAIKGLLGQ